MTELPLLRTKLHRPTVTDRLVCRPRLHEALDSGLEVPLTLVSAPAGCGKSMLVSHWAESLKQPCAWLSLDALETPVTEDYNLASSKFTGTIDKVTINLK